MHANQGLHFVDNLLDTGPAELFDTGTDEATNKWTRLFNQKSNRKNPSRDIAMAYLNQRSLQLLKYGVTFCQGKRCVITITERT
jgi:hypothetical protein